MITNRSIKKNIAVISAAAVMLTLLQTIDTLRADADDGYELITEYSDLWTGTVSAPVGVPVKWLIHVPDDTEPKGCAATVKIPGLGWGDVTNNSEDEYVTLTQGDNLFYEFTPGNTGDFIFTCRMGSGCHSNYIHITDNGEYNVRKPDDPTDITAEREGDKVTVRFTPPQAPEGAEITGYKAIATDGNGSRKKAVGTGNSVVFDGLDESLNYTIKITTLSTAGTSAGANEVILEAASVENEGTVQVESTAAENITAQSEQTTPAENAQVTPTQAAQAAQNGQVTQTQKAQADAAVSTDSPQTGVTQPIAPLALLTGSAGLALLVRKKRKQKTI